MGIPVGSPAAPKLCNVCRYPFSLAQNEQRIQKSVTAILSTALQSPDFFFVLLLHRIICYWLKREGSFKKTGVQVGHKSAEGIPSYIFKTKIIPKLSRIRWDTPTEKNPTEYKQLGPDPNTDNPEKGEVSGDKMLVEKVSIFSVCSCQRIHVGSSITSLYSSMYPIYRQ